MLEVIVAGVILAAMMTICLQMLHATTGRHRATDVRHLALREAANVMETLAATPWGDLTQQYTEQVKLSDEATRGLPAGELKISVTESDDQPDAKRIHLRIRWHNRSGRFTQPVQLVAWRYR